MEIFGDITSKGSEVLIGYCSECNRKKSIIVSDNTLAAECPQDFFKNLRKGGLNVSKKQANIVLKNTGRALNITANIATAAASRFPKNVLSILPEPINFYHICKSLYFGKFV